MLNALSARALRHAIPVTPILAEAYQAWVKLQPPQVGRWLAAQNFAAKPGSFCALPDAEGKVARVVVGLSAPASLWDLADLPQRLPAGDYQLDWDGEGAAQETLALGWVLGAYRFERYKKNDAATARLAIPAKADHEKIMACAEAIGLARDLINTPAEDMGPEELAAAVIATGKQYAAKVAVIVGDALLKKNYPAIHAVGRASSRAPRLIDLRWGDAKHPRLTLVGKGVCFDTGGLDLKPSSGMLLMKKDMGGAACALGVAALVMRRKLPVRLRLLIPAVDNAVAGNAYRPSDVIRMRNGLTVEVGNTDAEGRLVLADALAEAVADKPALLLDFATLTGAARTAVGADIAALFANDDALADALFQSGKATEDPLWRLPLHAAYARMLDSGIADLNSCPASPYAGAITAALFLQRFVGADIPWAHLDFMAWNLSARAGRPEGGEAMTVRAVFRMIERRFGKRVA